MFKKEMTEGATQQINDKTHKLLKSLFNLFSKVLLLVFREGSARVVGTAAFG